MRILPVMLELGDEILILGRRPLEIPLFNHRSVLITELATTSLSRTQGVR